VRLVSHLPGGSSAGPRGFRQSRAQYTAVVNIPLIVDAGGGFGEPAHVFNTIRVLEHAGAAGVHIEDQIFPSGFTTSRTARGCGFAEVMVKRSAPPWKRGGIQTL